MYYNKATLKFSKQTDTCYQLMGNSGDQQVCSLESILGNGGRILSSHDVGPFVIMEALISIPTNIESTCPSCGEKHWVYADHEPRVVELAN